MTFYIFILSVAASVFANFVFALSAILVGLFTSHRFRWFWIGLFGHVLNIEIDDVFENRNEAEKYLEQALKRTRTIKIYTSRGTDLHGTGFLDMLFRKVENRELDSVEILLPDPSVPAPLFDFTTQREGEISGFPSAIPNVGLLHKQINETLGHLTQDHWSERLKKAVSVRLTNLPHFARIFILDHVAYFAFYDDQKHGSSCRVFSSRRGVFFDMLNRKFALDWESGRDPFLTTAVDVLIPLKRVDGLIFDCDGTITNSMALHCECLQAALSQLNVTFSPQEFHSRAGQPTMEITKAILSTNGIPEPPNLQEIVDEKEKRFLDRIHELKPIHEVVDIIRNSQGRKRMAIASGATRQVIEAQLRQSGLSCDLFHAIISAEDCKNPKPSPEPFLLAASKIGVLPSNCLVFEDGEMGILAARAANMQYIDVRGIQSK